MSIRRHFAALAIAGLVVGTLAGPTLAAPAPGERPAAAEQDDGSYVPGAAALEGRIMAPCCWTQTIDIHGSEISTELRQEIRRRLRAGETADAIQASLVERYGPRILAVPLDSPLKKIAIGLSVLLGAAGVGAVFLLRRWKRQTATSSPGAAPRVGGKRDEWDDRLDDELGKIES
jgi:cytochrome c-type biogenesis protein CcmH